MSNNRRGGPFRPGAGRTPPPARTPTIVGVPDELEITIKAKKQSGGGYACELAITPGVDSVDALGIMTSVTANMVLEYKNARDALIAANLKVVVDARTQ